VLPEALRYPLRGRTARDALAVSVGLVLVALVLVRAGRALWPDPLAVVPATLAVVPAALFAGYLGDVLRAETGDTPGFRLSRGAARAGLRALLVAAAFLVPAAVALLATAYVVVSGGGGPVLTLAPTVALLVTVVSVYLLPAALATAVRRGVRAALRRSAVGGLAGGAYFFAWTAATSLVVVAWSALAAVGTGTLAGVVGAAGVAYAHVAAARLLGEGLARSRWDG
jgi:hypothetical protein